MSRVTRRHFFPLGLAAGATCWHAAAQLAAADNWSDVRQTGPFTVRSTFPLDEYQELWEELPSLEQELRRVLALRPPARPIEVLVLADRLEVEQGIKGGHPQHVRGWKVELFRHEGDALVRQRAPARVLHQVQHRDARGHLVGIAREDRVELFDVLGAQSKGHVGPSHTLNRRLVGWRGGKRGRIQLARANREGSWAKSGATLVTESLRCQGRRRHPSASPTDVETSPLSLENSPLPRLRCDVGSGSLHSPMRGGGGTKSRRRKSVLSQLWNPESRYCQHVLEVRF